MEMMLEKSKFKRSSYLNSKWAIKQQRQLTISTTHLALELLTDICCPSPGVIFIRAIFKVLESGLATE